MKFCLDCKYFDEKDKSEMGYCKLEYRDIMSGHQFGCSNFEPSEDYLEFIGGGYMAQEA